MVIKVALSAVFNIHYKGFIYREVDEVLEKLKIFLRKVYDYGFKASIFISGATAEIASRDKELIKVIKDGLRRGDLEVCNCSYSYPILAKLPLNEVKDQIKRSQEILAEVFGDVSPGFYPPESFFDPLLPLVLSELGFSWILLNPTACIHEFGETVPHLPVEILGVHNTRITGVFTCTKWDDLNHLFLLEELPPPPRITVIHLSEEDLFSVGEVDKKLALLSVLLKHVEADITLISDYIRETPASEEVTIGSPNPLWRLEILWSEARESIRTLESLAKTKQSLDAYTLLEKAIRHLYFSESSSAYFSKNRSPLLELESCEKALEATELARRALKILS